jgi:hypothetical protein
MQAERTPTFNAPVVGPAEVAPVDTRELSAGATGEVLVTDHDGRPAPGDEVLPASWDGPRNRVGKTNEHGALTLRWRPGFGDPRVLVALRARGAFLGGLRVLEASAGTRSSLRAALDPALLPGSAGAVFSTSLRLASAKSRLARTTYNLRDIEAAGSVIEQSFDRAEKLVWDKFDDSTSTSTETERRRGPLEVDAEHLAEGEVAFVSGSSDALSLAGQIDDELRNLRSSLAILDQKIVFTSMVLAGDEPTALVRGVVRDLSGSAAASVRVSAARLDVDGASPVTAITDQEGRFQ